MSEMIERVARALYHDWWAHKHGTMPAPVWASADTWMQQARAAVEAMRIPTEAMINAGNSESDIEGGPTCINIRDELPPIWRAMIDAALK